VPGEYHRHEITVAGMNMRLSGFVGRGGSFTQLSQQQIFRLLNGTFRIGNALILQFHVFVTEHGEEIANTIHTGLLLSQNLSADIAFVDDRCGIRLLDGLC
jgi:hypothetical protein